MAVHTVSPASKFRVGEVLRFEVAGQVLAIGRTERGWFAMDDACPHAHGSLGEGMIDDGCVICPVHGYAYDITTGEGMDDGEEVRVYPVEVRDDVLHIDLGAHDAGADAIPSADGSPT